MTNKYLSALPFFLAGLATGVAVALLAAPYSGAETRHRIGNKAAEGTDLLRAGITAGKDYIKGCGTELRDMAKEVVA
jgi:gas vesicle protein